MDFAKKLTNKDVTLGTKAWNERPSSALSHAWNEVGLGTRSSSEEEIQTAESVNISEECVQLGIDSWEGEVWLDTDVGENNVCGRIAGNLASCKPAIPKKLLPR